MAKNISRRLFKKLTPRNWRKLDGTANYIVRTNGNGTTEKLTADDWASLILEPEHSCHVPEDVRNLFEVAQGVLCYGCYFYPLYTLGSEQFYRVLDAAIQHKTTAMNVPKHVKTFAKKHDWLKEKDALTESRLCQWHAARQLRNMTSHTDRQSLYDPPTSASQRNSSTRSSMLKLPTRLAIFSRR